MPRPDVAFGKLYIYRKNIGISLCFASSLYVGAASMTVGKGSLHHQPRAHAYKTGHL